MPPNKQAPECPDCETFELDQWRVGRCDECHGSGRDGYEELCVYCDGTGSPACCRCEGTGTVEDLTES